MTEIYIQETSVEFRKGVKFIIKCLNDHAITHNPQETIELIKAAAYLIEIGIFFNDRP